MPALTAQVKRVGDISSIVVGPIDDALRAFLLARRSLLLERTPDPGVVAAAFRLPLSFVEFIPVFSRMLAINISSWSRAGLGGGFSAFGSLVPKTRDSGTIRRVVVSTLFEIAGCRCVSVEPVGFGRPRAAGANESSVDKLARRAASWST